MEIKLNCAYMVKEPIYLNDGEIPVGAIIVADKKLENSVICTIKPFIINEERESLTMELPNSTIHSFCTIVN